MPFEFVPVTDLLAVGADKFGSNPLHRFPVLEHDGLRLIESNLICEYLIENFGRDSAIPSFYPSVEQKTRDAQRLAVMNGAMESGVNLLRAKRSGIERWDDYPFFRQELAAIGEALDWLERDLGARDSYYPSRLTMLDITLMCCVEWLVFREFLKEPARYANLDRFVRAHRDRPSFRSTHPSIAEVR